MGLAYSTESMRHLLNVPSGKISALPDQPGHFVEWLRANYDADASAADFLPRRVYGRYIQSILERVPQIEHRRTSVIDCRPRGGGIELQLSSGETITARAVVLAVGNHAPAPLKGVQEALKASGIYCDSAWEPSTFLGLDAEAPVTLIGSGLTAVDVLLRLRETGHRGVIVAMSRHGLLPSRHAGYAPLAGSAIVGEAPTSARELLRRLRQALRTFEEWRAVIDSVRDRSNELWLALPLNEQRRFRRHLSRRWEVVRHRMAPSIAEQVEDELQAGTPRKEVGHLEAIVSANHGAVVHIQTKGGEHKKIPAARVINCTGPDPNYRRVPCRLLQSLFKQRLIAAGPHGNGLWTDANGALRGADRKLFESVVQRRSRAVRNVNRIDCSARDPRASGSFGRNGICRPARPK